MKGLINCDDHVTVEENVEMRVWMIVQNKYKQRHDNVARKVCFESCVVS